jgi:hypothetical protein
VVEALELFLQARLYRQLWMQAGWPSIGGRLGLAVDIRRASSKRSASRRCSPMPTGVLQDSLLEGGELLCKARVYSGRSAHRRAQHPFQVMEECLC